MKFIAYCVGGAAALFLTFGIILFGIELGNKIQSSYGELAANCYAIACTGAFFGALCYFGCET